MMGMISFQPSFRFNGRADPQATITVIFLTLTDHAWALNWFDLVVLCDRRKAFLLLPPVAARHLAEAR